ncbi:protein serine/threonine phosphatase [Aureococcus anophagefferens]|nr:protein serine/threonine phosphatase [Aureococcus anophagefferens]
MTTWAAKVDVRDEHARLVLADLDGRAARAAPPPLEVEHGEAAEEAGRQQALAFTTEVKEGKIDEYLKYHDEIWPDVAAGLRAAGVTQLTIFRVPDTRRLFMYITTAGDTVMGVAPPASARAPEGFDSVKGDAYTKKRSKRRSFQQAPEDRGSEVLLQAAEAAEAAKQAAGKERDRSYQAKEIYEPDWALSPFPSTVVGTFSCHGIEPSYFTAGATAKINQDRGCVVQPYGGDPRRALFAVFDGHGERGDIVSDYA